MVFASLGPSEKQAFFDLLDEYFQSRPELLSGLNNVSSSTQEGSRNVEIGSKAAASAVRNALASNPDATAHLISTGLRHGAQTSSSNKNSSFAAAAANPAIANSVGRIAAASLAFQGSQQRANSNSPPVPATRNTSPQSLAPQANVPSFSQRTPSPSTEEDSNNSEPPPSRSPLPRPSASGATGLVQGKTIGGINTSQWSRGLPAVQMNSLPSSTTPSSFAKRHDFAPPPTRRVPDNPPAVPKRAITPEPEPEEGEWAEALYDYDSAETGDLVIKTHDRIKIVTRDSDDWWTGEINGRSGLFPASYVKVI